MGVDQAGAVSKEFPSLLRDFPEGAVEYVGAVLGRCGRQAVKGSYFSKTYFHTFFLFALSWGA